eukprot:gene33579-41436_t
MAMSRDRGTSRQALDQGYGVVCDAQGEPLDDIIVIDANQEHGIVAHRSGDPARMPDLPVGALVRILPNHACATAAQHESYAVIDGADTRIRAHPALRLRTRPKFETQAGQHEHEPEHTRILREVAAPVDAPRQKSLQQQ